MPMRGGSISCLPTLCSVSAIQRAPLNLERGIRYIQADHVVAGVEYYTRRTMAKFSVEGFHKWYDRYPLAGGQGHQPGQPRR
jgi:hypothetical protein